MDISVRRFVTADGSAVAAKAVSPTLRSQAADPHTLLPTRTEDVEDKGHSLNASRSIGFRVLSRDPSLAVTRIYNAQRLPIFALGEGALSIETLQYLQNAPRKPLLLHYLPIRVTGSECSHRSNFSL